MPEDFEVTLHGDEDFESSDFEYVGFEGEQSESEFYDVLDGTLIDQDLVDNPRPVAVEHTSDIYQRFASQFGESEAAALQRAWNDRAVHGEAIVQVMGAMHPETTEIYARHALDDGAFSAQGLPHAIEFTMKALNVRSVSDLAAAHGELEQIYFDHADEVGNLSIAGLYRALDYVGRARGYKFHYHRGKR